MCPTAAEKQETLQPSVICPEPWLSEEPQHPGMKVSDITKTETVSCSTTQCFSALHTGTKGDEHVSVPTYPLMWRQLL